MRNNWDDFIWDFPFLQAAYHCRIYRWAPIFSITVRRLWFTLFDTVNLCYVNSVTPLSLNCICTIPEGLALAFPAVLWKAMCGQKRFCKKMRTDSGRVTGAGGSAKCLGGVMRMRIFGVLQKQPLSAVSDCNLLCLFLWIFRLLLVVNGFRCDPLNFLDWPLQNKVFSFLCIQ